MAQLTKLTVRGFKSIRELEDFELRNVNVLIGANGAGKSNFMSLFPMMAAIGQKRLQLYVQEHDGPDALLFGGRKLTKQMVGEFSFGRVGYRLTLSPSGPRLIFAREETWSAAGVREGVTRSLATGQDEAQMLDMSDPTFDLYVLPALATWRVYHFHDTGVAAPVRQAQPVRDNLLLKPDASNLAPFLRFLRERYPSEYGRIVETVRMVAPFLGDFVYRREAKERVELEWFQAHDLDTPMSPRQLSDGTLRFISLATLLQQPAHLQPDTILIDEPELGLHPAALTILAALLRQAADERQLVVSTQSVDLVNELAPEDIVVVSLKNEASTFERLEAEQLQEWLADYTLGDLWKMNVIGGRPSR